MEYNQVAHSLHQKWATRLHFIGENYFGLSHYIKCIFFAVQGMLMSFKKISKSTI